MVMEPVTVFAGYGFGLLFIGAAAYALYSVEDHRLGRRGEIFGLTSNVLPYIALTAWFHPPANAFTFRGTILISFLVGLGGALLVGAFMAAWAADRPNRRSSSTPD